MSWTKKVKHPSKLVEPGQEIECQVLEVDAKAKRISLGLKQLEPDPWTLFTDKYHTPWGPAVNVDGEHSDGVRHYFIQNAVEWIRDAWGRMAPHSTGAVYLNYAGREERDAGEIVRTAFGPNYARLVEIKTKYDPTNFFRLNQNIKPRRVT